MSGSPFQQEWDKDPLVSHWDEDPEWSVADWKYEVANDDTRQGYHEWVAHNRDTEMREREEDEERDE